jgi:hypothetical protein
MSDDEYYYEYEVDDYQYADEVPELVVSALFQARRLRRKQSFQHREAIS